MGPAWGDAVPLHRKLDAYTARAGAGQIQKIARPKTGVGLRCGPMRVLALLVLLVAASCEKRPLPAEPQPPAPRAAVTGTVLRAGGQVAAQAMVTLIRRPLPAPGMTDTLVFRVTETDGAGRFRFDDVPRGHFCVSAADSFSDDFPPVPGLAAAAILEVVNANTSPPAVGLRLGLAGRFRGVVRDTTSGDSVAAFVMVESSYSIASSDFDGAYLIFGVPPGTWNVVASRMADSVTVHTGVIAGTMPAAATEVALPDLYVADRVVYPRR